MRSRVWLAVAATLALLAWPLSAAAQRFINELIDRPSIYGPSSALGYGPSRAFRRPFVPLRVTPRGAPLIGQSDLSFALRRQPRPHSSMLPVARAGLFSDLRGPRGAALSSYARGRDASVISGLTSAMSLAMPLPGQQRGYLPALDAQAYTPRPSRTLFQEFFELSPVPPEQEPETVDSVAERLEQRTGERTRYAEQKGLDLFKQATVEARDPRTGRYPNCQDCDEKLARAVQQFKLVRELDQQAALPSLLTAHASLEQERPWLALHALIEAFERNPYLFSPEFATIDEFFGDAEGETGRSAYLESQMRRYLRTGVFNLDSPEAHGLSAYCAWRLGDTDGARQAAQRATELTQDEPVKFVMLLSFLAALQEALP